MEAGWLPLDMPKTGWNWIRCHWASSSGLGSLLDVSEIVPFKPSRPMTLFNHPSRGFPLCSQPSSGSVGEWVLLSWATFPNSFPSLWNPDRTTFLENRTRFCLFLNISPSLPLGLFSQNSPLENLPSNDQYLPLSMFEETRLCMACFWIHVSGQLIWAIVVGTRNIKH